MVYSSTLHGEVMQCHVFWIEFLLENNLHIRSIDLFCIVSNFPHLSSEVISIYTQVVTYFLLLISLADAELYDIFIYFIIKYISSGLDFGIILHQLFNNVFLYSIYLFLFLLHFIVDNIL